MLSFPYWRHFKGYREAQAGQGEARNGMVFEIDVVRFAAEEKASGAWKLQAGHNGMAFFQSHMKRNGVWKKGVCKRFLFVVWLRFAFLLASIRGISTFANGKFSFGVGWGWSMAWDGDAFHDLGGGLLVFYVRGGPFFLLLACYSEHYTSGAFFSPSQRGIYGLVALFFLHFPFLRIYTGAMFPFFPLHFFTSVHALL